MLPVRSLNTLFVVRFLMFALGICFVVVFALNLHCCMPVLSSCSEQGLLFVAVQRLLITVASLAVEPRLQAVWASAAVGPRLWSTGSVAVTHGASLLYSRWDLPGPGIEATFPALAGGSHPLHHWGSPRPHLFEQLPDLNIQQAMGIHQNALWRERRAWLHLENQQSFFSNKN